MSPLREGGDGRPRRERLGCTHLSPRLAWQDKVRRRSSIANALFLTQSGRRRSSVVGKGGKITPYDGA